MQINRPLISSNTRLSEEILATGTASLHDYELSLEESFAAQIIESKLPYIAERFGAFKLRITCLYFTSAESRKDDPRMIVPGFGPATPIYAVVRAQVHPNDDGFADPDPATHIGDPLDEFDPIYISFHLYGGTLEVHRATTRVSFLHRIAAKENSDAIAFWQVCEDRRAAYYACGTDEGAA